MSFQETEIQSVRMSGVDYSAMRNEIAGLRQQRNELLEALIVISEESTDLGARECAMQAIAKAKGEA